MVFVDSIKKNRGLIFGLLLFPLMSLGLYLVKVYAFGLPNVPIEEVGSPAKPEYVLESGMALQDIALEAYGHEKFSGFIMAVNGRDDVTRLPVGLKFRTPSLAVGMKECGMHAEYQPVFNAIAKAIYDFYEVLPEYEAEKNSVANKGKNQIVLSEDVAERIIKSAELLEAACRALGNVKSNHKVPRMTIGQFEQAAGSIRQLARGRVGIYDLDVIGKPLGHGFNNALVWIKENFQ